MKMKLKKGDNVLVISGKDKGKEGKIILALPAENKIVVEGVALAKRHVKRSAGQSNHIVERPAKINVSNVMLIDPETKKGTRVGRVVEGNKIVRVAKKSGKKIA